jgi:hypothetical protein
VIDTNIVVSSPHFRWLPGARYVCSRPDPMPPVVGRVPDIIGREWKPYPNSVPDFDDPATFGCLIFLVREAWGVTSIFSDYYAGKWCVEFTDLTGQARAFYGDSEVDSFIAALIAAPARSDYA